jgi:hypothetical protein
MKRPTREPRSRKKPYVPPRLTRYGQFKHIVQGAGGNKNDPGQGNRSRP